MPCKLRSKEVSVQMTTELGSNYLKATLFLDHRTNRSISNNRITGYWFNLIKYMKRYAEWIDINRLRTDFIQMEKKPKAQKNSGITKSDSMAEKKNDMIASLLLRILSEGAILSKNLLGGYSPVADMRYSMLRKLKENLALNYWTAKYLTSQHKSTILKMFLHQPRETLFQEEGYPELDASQLHEKEDQTPKLLTATRHLSYMSIEELRPSPMIVLDYNSKKEKTDTKETIKRQDKFMRSYKLNKILYDSATKEEQQKHHLVSFDEFSNFMEDNKASLLSFFGSKIVDMRKDQSRRKSPHFPVLHTVNTTLFTIVQRLGHRFVLLSLRLSLSNYLEQVTFAVLKGKQLSLAKNFGLECVVDLLNTRLTNSDLYSDTDTNERKFTVGDLLQDTEMSQRYEYAILILFLSSKILGTIKQSLIRHAQSRFSRSC